MNNENFLPPFYQKDVIGQSETKQPHLVVGNSAKVEYKEFLPPYVLTTTKSPVKGNGLTDRLPLNVDSNDFIPYPQY